MKTEFKPILYRDIGGNPNPSGAYGGGGFTGGIGKAAAGSTPWGLIAQAGGGFLQSLIGGFQEHKAQRDLEKLINTYQPNKSILDFYSKALNRYNANPYTSPIYNAATQRIRAGTAQGIQSFQDRRSANTGISTLIQNQNDAELKAAAAAEGQKGQELAQLGQATTMKANEEKIPFTLKYGLLASKAGGGAQLLNAGVSNIFGAANTSSQLDILKKIYGQQ